MFASIRQLQADPTSVPEIIRRVKNEYLPRLRKINGFVSSNLVDAGKGLLISTTVFQTEAGAVESTRLATEAAKNWNDLVSAPLQVTSGMIVVHDTN